MITGDQNGLDRRQRKTRAALHRALIDLIAKIEYDAITVDEIARTADVARATFYAHYRDKSDLLHDATGLLLDELTSRVGRTAPRHEPRYSGIGVTAIFEHVDGHRDLYRLLISGGGGPGARSLLIDTLCKSAAGVFGPLGENLGGEPRIPLTLTSAVFVGGLLLTVESWLAGEFDLGPREMAAVYIQSQVHGLEWSLGLPAGLLEYVAPA